MSSRCGILNLPLELLDLLYKFIPDLRDKLNFAKAHGVLGNAFAFHAGDIFKSYDFGERPIEDWSDGLSLCGSSVTTIWTSARKTTVDVVELASMYCPNLEEFTFPVGTSSWNLIKPMLLRLQNLVSIKLMNSFEKVYVVKTLLQMPKLKTLILIDFNPQNLKEVRKLVNLTEFSIWNTREEPIDILQMCSPMKSIGSLNFNHAIISQPKRHGKKQLWPKIESLDITYGVFHTPLPYLPTLKHLSIGNTHMSLTDVFGQSAISYGMTLERLRFRPNVSKINNTDDVGIITKLIALKTLEIKLEGDDCLDRISQLENLEELIVKSSRITNDGVMMVINRCKKLRYLNIVGCGKVDSGMVMEAVAALSLRPKADNPFLLLVSHDIGNVDKVQHLVLSLKVLTD